MYSIEIKTVRKIYSQADNGYVFDVTFDIKLEDEVVETRKLGYPLETTLDEIKEDIQKYLHTYSGEQKSKVENEKRDKVEKEADATIDALTGAEFTEKIK